MRSRARKPLVFAAALAACVAAPAHGQSDAEIQSDLRRARMALDDCDYVEADQRFRRVLARAPESEDAANGLALVAERRPLPSRSQCLADVRALVPRSFRKFETEHFVALSGAEPKWTRRQLIHLERTYEAFHEHAEGLGFEPWPLANKLVCVFFASRADYADFGLRQDGRRVAATFGYYSLAGDRTVLFSSPADHELDEFGTRRLVAAVVHEAIHHLHYHTGVQSRYVQYPLWISEGLATVFETNVPDEPFGPDEDFAPRRRRFEKLIEEDRVIPLSALVRFDSTVGLASGYVAAIYNQSYALVCWLMHERIDEVSAYLAAMRAEPPGRPSSRRHLEIFETAFGDVDALERAWLRHELATVDSASMPDSLRRRVAALTDN